MYIRDPESTKTPRRPIKKVTMPHAAVEAEKELISTLQIPDADPEEQGDVVITDISYYTFIFSQNVKRFLPSKRLMF